MSDKPNADTVAEADLLPAPPIATFVHQEDGIRWLLARETTPLVLSGAEIYGGLLCDDMGMGKTMQLTQIIIRRPVAYTLIVVPVSVAGQWRDALLAVLPATGLKLYICVSRRHARLCSVPGLSPVAGPLTPTYGRCIDIGSIPVGAVVIASYGQMLVALSKEEKARVAAARKAWPTKRGRGKGPGASRGVVTVARLGIVEVEAEASDDDEDAVGMGVAGGAGVPNTIPFPACVWDRVILDEAHTIKNRRTQTYGSAAKLRMSATGSRWAVTGTPVQNYLDDIYTLYKFTGVPVALLRKKSIAAAQWFFAHLALRRTVADLSPEQIATIRFPEAYVDHETDIVYKTEEEAEFYRRVTGQISAQLARLERYPDQQEAARCKLELFNQLRFLAVHPNVYINCVNHQRPASPYPPWTGTVSKQEEVVDLVGRLRARGKSFVMFTHFVEEMDQYRAAIEAAGYTVYEVHGGQTAAVRERVIAKSRRGAGSNREEIARIMENVVPGDLAWKIAEMAQPLQAMLVHIRAGGAGLNLQHFDTVIMPSPDWNPAMEAQAVGRCHRIGQQHRVHVYRFHIREIQGVIEQIEVYMKQKQEIKKAVASAVTDKTATPESTPEGTKLVKLATIAPAKGGVKTVVVKKV